MEEETYSPTVHLESIMLSSLIDAYEKRHVRTINIKGKFLKAKVPDNLDSIVKMEGKSAELMNKICLNFIIEEDGIMYLKCVKALYGHVDMARLFYDDLNKMLVDKMGFKRNQYDPCVYNKETNDGVITAHTHVDDIKISSKSEKQLDIVVNDFIKHYKEITVHKEDSHDYLGMVMSHDIEN
jgi:UDP-2,3-diacylglucosamine pyrophosphatase LpxH